jgi:hypothetical protein
MTRMSHRNKPPNLERRGIHCKPFALIFQPLIANYAVGLRCYTRQALRKPCITSLILKTSDCLGLRGSTRGMSHIRLSEVPLLSGRLIQQR